MKLIDIVILELSKRGGWPEKAVCVVQDEDTKICFSAKIDGLRKPGTDWIGGEWNGPWVNFFSNHLAEDNSTSIVTHEQYEAALAASKPEWDGNGLPPVGCECEHHSPSGMVTVVKIIAHFQNRAAMVAVFIPVEREFKTVDQAISDCFRPIRSEADKKKYATIEEMLSTFFGAPPVEESNENDRVAMAELYDAIKSGKIVID